GPRHLTGLVPFLLLPAALEMENAHLWPKKGIALGLVLSSVFVTAALSFVNYIPDDVSEGVFGLFVPLAQSGRLVPSPLSFFGLPGPVAGAVAIALTTVTAALIVAVLLNPVDWKAGATAMTVLVLCIGLHWGAFRNTDQDVGALRLLERVWLAQ